MLQIPEEKFALAIVSSSSPQLSLEEKFKLYQDAYKMADEHNQDIADKQVQDILDSVDVF
ncbi:hypothetical protein HZZ02_05770 [Streptococcus danieliae]|nr:hypothetical protein [Streptococcus danieliae]